MRKIMPFVLFLLLFCGFSFGKGVPTMGLSGSGADFTPSLGEGPQDALRRALNQYGVVYILPGIYNFTAPLSGSFNGARIMGSRQTTLKVGHSGSIGLLDLSGDKIVLDGFRALAESFVADQTLINLSGKDVSVLGVTFETTINALADSSTDGVITPVAAPTGSTSTPMVMLDFDAALRPVVDRCTFLPDYAVTCYRATDGAGHIIANSNFSNDLDAGLGGLSVNAGPTIGYAENAAPRLCWRCIQMDGAEWALIQGNRFFGLGDSNYDPGSGPTPYFTGAPYELDFVIRLKKGTTVPTGGLLTTQSETGHMRVIGNTAEWCAAPKGIQLWGIPSSIITGNMLGLNASPDALGEAWIVITDADDGASGTDYCGDICIYGNNIHNAALTSTEGAAVFARMVQDFKFGGNNVGVVASKYAMQLAGVNVESVSISGNSFRGNGTTCFTPVNINTGSGITNGIYVGGNDIEGFANTVSTLNSSGTIATTVTTIVRGSGSFVTDGWCAGDMFTAAGLDTAGDNGKVLTIASVAALTLTLQGYPLTADADNGTDVVLTEVSSAAVKNGSSSSTDYFLEGMATSLQEPWQSNTSTGLLTNITIASNVVTRAAGSYLTDGFRQGDMVVLLGALATAADIGKVGYISSLTATAMTLTNVSLTNDASSGENTVIMKVTGMSTGNVSLD